MARFYFSLSLSLYISSLCSRVCTNIQLSMLIDTKWLKKLASGVFVQEHPHICSKPHQKVPRCRCRQSLLRYCSVFSTRGFFRVATEKSFWRARSGTPGIRYVYVRHLGFSGMIGEFRMELFSCI